MNAWFRPQPRTTWFWVLPLLPALFVLVVLWSRNMGTYRRLEDDGIATTGEFTSSGCHDGRFTYEFNANGRRWSGRARAWRYGVDCAEVVLGGPVRVVYVPDNPARSAATRDAAALYVQELTIVVGLATACYAACVAIQWVDSRRRPN